MTPQERLIVNLSGEQPDRISYEFGFTPQLAKEFQQRTGSNNPVEYYDFDYRELFLLPTNSPHDFSDFLGELPAGSEVDEWGVGHRPGSKYHFTKMIHPLAGKALNALDKYPFPDIEAAYRSAHWKSDAACLHDRGYFVQGFAEHIFERAWYLRGLDNLLMDFYINHEFASRLLDIITEKVGTLAEKLARYCDMVRLGDDVGTQKGMMMSPQCWREWLKPRLAKVIARARTINPQVFIWYHSDGDISEILDDLIEVGVNVLNPVQPECLNPFEVRKRFGRRLAMWGTVGTQTTMPFGSPEEVQRVIKQLLVGLDWRGIVVAPTHILEPDVPWANIDAFVEAMQKYGSPKNRLNK